MTGQIKKYQRKIIGVEKKLGFMYVPAIGQEHLPAETAKISVLLEGDKAVSSLTYNSTHKRIFGLTDWYNKRAIVVGSIVNVEFEGSLMKLSVSSNIELVETEEEDEKTVDLSGLSSVAKGNIVEDRIKELILLYGQGLLNVFKPVVDNRGIDLIVMRDGVFNPIFLQVKSRFNAHQKESLLVDIRDSTFSPHHSFYIIAASFNPISLELDDRLLFIPSEELNVKVKPNEKYGIRRITVSLKEKSKAQWTTSLIPKSELVERLMEKFEEMSKYYK